MTIKELTIAILRTLSKGSIASGAAVISGASTPSVLRAAVSKCRTNASEARGSTTGSVGGSLSSAGGGLGLGRSSAHGG